MSQGKGTLRCGQVTCLEMGVVPDDAAGTMSSPRVFTEGGRQVRVRGGGLSTAAEAGSEGGARGEECRRPLGAGTARQRSLLQSPGTDAALPAPGFEPTETEVPLAAPTLRSLWLHRDRGPF